MRTALARRDCDLSIGLVMQPDISRNALRFTAHQMYTTGSVVHDTPTQHSPPIPPLIIQGVKKCEIWPRFRHHSF